MREEGNLLAFDRLVSRLLSASISTCWSRLPASVTRSRQSAAPFEHFYWGQRSRRQVSGGAK